MSENLFLQSSGFIRFTHLQNVLGGSYPISIKEYQHIGNLTKVSNFYNKSLVTFLDNALIRRRINLNSTTASLDLANMNAAFNNTSAVELAHVTSFAVPVAEYFGLEYTGWMIVPASGSYTFGLTSDDGSDFAIYQNNAWDIVTTAYGYKPPEASPPNPGSRNLVIGVYYPIRIRMHEQGGGEALNLFWRTPSNSTFATVPFTIFKCNAATPSIDSIRLRFPEPRS